MGEVLEFTIGSDVFCGDAVCGDLRRLVVDPVAKAVTHLVVEPRHHRYGGHLVPVELVELASSSAVHLSCSEEQFEALEEADEKRYLPGREGYGYEPQHLMVSPLFTLGLGGVGTTGPKSSEGPEVTVMDRVPVDEVEVSRGDQVYASDGAAVGRVRGLVVDPRDHHATHVLLEEGHLWGRKEVVIPIGVVTAVEDGVSIDLSKDEIEELPPVDFEKES